MENQYRQAMLAIAKAKFEETAQTQEARLAQADELKAAGSLSAAAQLYLRLASDRPETEHVKAARERFIEMRKELEQTLDGPERPAGQIKG